MSRGCYLSTIFLGTILVDLVVLLLTYLIPLSFNLWQYILAFILMIVPSSEVVISLLNWFIAKVTPVSFIPKMDYSKGIPESERTIVVIPAILGNSKSAIDLLKKLEIYYLANRDKNIFFALLGDLCDSNNESETQDNAINEEGIKFVNKLNKKYAKDGEDRFFFFNKRELYNESEKVYMGYERKRGKLMEFMALIRGSEETTYNIISSDIDSLKSAKYIITLDSDTFLPIGSAKKLLSAMSHVLNNPYIENNSLY
jgi:hypothetical protein